MKDNTKNNTLLLTVIGVATLLVAVVGATFAYFTAAMNPGESEATVKVNAGQLKINFANTNSVQIADQVQPTAATCDAKKPADFDTKPTAYLCDQADYTPVGAKTFTLTGTNTTDASKNMKMPYTIKMKITQNQFSTGALKYNLVGSKTGDAATGEIINIPEWVDIANGANTEGIVLGNGFFPAGNNIIHQYTLNIYFPDNHVVQDVDKNKVFGATVEVTTSEITAA